MATILEIVVWYHEGWRSHITKTSYFDANDVLFFAYGDQTLITHMMKSIAELSSLSGLLPSARKSSSYFCNCSAELSSSSLWNFWVSLLYLLSSVLMIVCPWFRKLLLKSILGLRFYCLSLEGFNCSRPCFLLFSHFGQILFSSRLQFMSLFNLRLLGFWVRGILILKVELN